MKSFFVSYNIFFFENILLQLTDFSKAYSKPSRKPNQSKKRSFTEISPLQTLELDLTKRILQTLQSCFRFDKDSFIDSVRFNKLINPIANQLDTLHHPSSEYSDFVKTFVKPTVIALFQLVHDDYKWKDFNYLILSKLETKEASKKLAVLDILLELVETLRESVLVLINDIMHFLSNTLDDENLEVEKISKQIVLRLEEISGENI